MTTAQQIKRMTKTQLIDHLGGDFADVGGKPLGEHSLASLRDLALADLALEGKSMDELRRIAYGEVL